MLVKEIKKDENPILYYMIIRFYESIKNKELTQKEEGMLQVMENEIPKDILKAYLMNLNNSIQTPLIDLKEYFKGVTLVLSWLL